MSGGHNPLAVEPGAWNVDQEVERGTSRRRFSGGRPMRCEAMFCRNFGDIVGDLAAERLMEAGVRERALHHVAGCAVCAARLNAELALDASLRALAESDQN